MRCWGVGKSVSSMKQILFFLCALLSCAVAGCDNYDEERIPMRNVRIEINTAEWSVYGVHGYMEWNTFIRNAVPQGFTWRSNEYSGFGGVLLVCGLEEQLLAYDLACPVECQSNVRVHVDEAQGIAVCNLCGSTYDVFNGYGQPLSGAAKDAKYGLTSYRVIPSATGCVITR